MKCAVTGTPYTVFGYKGKQVRDNIHSSRSGQRVLALFRRRRGAARSTTSAAAGLELLDARSHCAGRAADRPADAVDLQRHESRRRSHLVGQRHPEILGALPGLGSLVSLERTIEEIHDEMAERAAPAGSR